MRFEQRHDPFRAFLDDRRVFRRAPDNRHAPDLALAECMGRLQDRVSALAYQTVKREPFGHLLLIALTEPAIMKHRLCAPLVREVFQQISQKGLRRVGGNDGAFLVAALQFENHRRRIVVPASIRKLNDRNNRGLHMRKNVLPAVGLLPDMGELAIAQDRPHLHRIRRA